MPDRQKQTVKRGCYPIKGRRYTRENVIDKIISAIADYIQIELIQITPVSVLSFPGLEIRQHQRRVFRGREEVNLTRLEYSTLVFLASNPGIVLIMPPLSLP